MKYNVFIQLVEGKSVNIPMNEETLKEFKKQLDFINIIYGDNTQRFINKDAIMYVDIDPK